MRNRRNSWTTYSIGLLVIWAIVLALVWWLDSSTVRKEVLFMFGGYFAGWLSATIKVALMRRDGAQL